MNLSATDAWAIHPVFPQLSVTIDRQNPTGGLFVAGWAAAARKATAMVHTVIGSPFPVVTTMGGRQALEGTLTLFAEKENDRANLIALVNDQTPILFRYPTSIGSGWEDGFYSVGDYSGGAASAPRGGGWWKISLPLTRVQAPPVTTVAGWDYPTITATFADYADLTASFADYQSLTAEPGALECGTVTRRRSSSRPPRTGPRYSTTVTVTVPGGSRPAWFRVRVV
jgi:hypothetical protein